MIRHSRVPATVVMDSALSQSAKAVALAIGLHINALTGEAFPAQGTLATELGVSRDTIRRGTEELEAQGHLTVERRHRTSSVYRWNDQPALRSKSAVSSVANLPPKMGSKSATPTTQLLTTQTTGSLRSRTAKVLKEPFNRQPERLGAVMDRVRPVPPPTG